MKNKKICNCPYYKSCHSIRQEIQKEYRDKTGRGLSSCPFLPYLREMYNELDK